MQVIWKELDNIIFLDEILMKTLVANILMKIQIDHTKQCRPRIIQSQRTARRRFTRGLPYHQCMVLKGRFESYETTEPDLDVAIYNCNETHPYPRFIGTLSKETHEVMIRLLCGLHGDLQECTINASPRRRAFNETLQFTTSMKHILILGSLVH